MRRFCELVNRVLSEAWRLWFVYFLIGFDMSTKNSLLVASAALALNFTVAANASPICEGLLNDLSVTEFGAAEVDLSGRVMVLVTVNIGGVDESRPVADSLGNVKLFTDANAAMTLAKRSNLTPGLEVTFVKMVKAGTVGDPIAALKAKYKRFKAEAAMALKQVTTVAAKQSAAVALGWDTAAGTPENAEFVDLQARTASVAEWRAFNDAQVVSLAASLTGAGIDPLTVV